LRRRVASLPIGGRVVRAKWYRGSISYAFARSGAGA
jgi:hypothetical protein